MTRRVLHLVLLTTAGLLLARIPALPYREFDPDEFEHAHAAWSLFQGMIPYRDFFEHHTPWYYYALRPLFNWFSVDTSFESATHYLVLGRVVSLLLTILSIVLVVRIGRLWADRGVGLVAALLLASQPIFLHKTAEMRPDVLAQPFFLGSLWFLLRGLGTEHRRWFLAGGLSIGAAIMCTQKMLFVLPGALAGLGLWALSARSRTLSIGAFLLGICVPAALTWAAFASQNAGSEFVTSNFILNAQWRHTPTRQFLKLLETSGPVLAVSLWGVYVSSSRLFGAEKRSSGDLLLLCTAVGLFVGVLVVPVAHRQYYLMPLPIVCLFAARGLLAVAERARTWLVAVAAISLAVLPGIGLRDAYVKRNDHQLARLRQVFETTRPTDLVMDGWQGMGVFRPHAFHYFFLHPETMAMLPRPRLDAYLDDLESGRVRPRLIALDENLLALGPRFVDFVTSRYVSRDGFFYYAR